MTAIDDPSVFLDDASEAEWALLHDQFDLADGFWLGFLFSDGWTAPRVMAGRAAGKLRGKGHRLREWRFDGTKPDEVLSELVSAAKEGTHDCLWVEALSREASPAWGEFLMRANERREVFARYHRGGLVLVAPRATKVLAQERSPDLWAFRSIVVELVAPPPTSTGEGDDARPEREGGQSPNKAESGERFEAAYQWTMQSVNDSIRAERIDAARVLLLRLMALARTEQTPRAWVARAWARLAECEQRQGDASAAIDHYQNALRDCSEVDVSVAPTWSSEVYWAVNGPTRSTQERWRSQQERLNSSDALTEGAEFRRCATCPSASTGWR
ncbi:MAG: tetratricopeptide repeat protein [Polyangiales bacterium]